MAPAASASSPAPTARSASEPRARPQPEEEPVALTSEETLVLLNYDADSPMQELASRTGLTEFRLNRIVANLKTRGVLDLDDAAPTDPGGPPIASAPPTAKAPPPSAAKAPPPSVRTLALEDDELEPDDDLESHPTIVEMELPIPVESSRRRPDETPISEAAPDTETTVVDDGGDDFPVPVDSSPFAVKPASQPHSDDDLPVTVTNDADLPSVTKSEPRPRTGSAAIADPALSQIPSLAAEPLKAGEGADDHLPEEADAAVSGESPSEPEDGADTSDAASVLAHFEKVLMKLGTDMRTKLAETSSERMDLLALCYDKEPQVVRALWQNVNISHDQARFAAFHHRTPFGLDLIAARAEFLKDQPTQRRLIRNPTVSEQLLRRILLPKRLLEIYKITLDREGLGAHPGERAQLPSQQVRDHRPRRSDGAHLEDRGPLPDGAQRPLDRLQDRGAHLLAPDRVDDDRAELHALRRHAPLGHRTLSQAAPRQEADPPPQRAAQAPELPSDAKRAF
jgi:hypothetical protein